MDGALWMQTLAVTEVITINGKSLKDWAKTGLNWLLEEIFETHNCVSTA